MTTRVVLVTDDNAILLVDIRRGMNGKLLGGTVVPGAWKLSICPDAWWRIDPSGQGKHSSVPLPKFLVEVPVSNSTAGHFTDIIAAAIDSLKGVQL